MRVSSYSPQSLHVFHHRNLPETFEKDRTAWRQIISLRHACRSPRGLLRCDLAQFRGQPSQAVTYQSSLSILYLHRVWAPKRPQETFDHSHDTMGAWKHWSHTSACEGGTEEGIELVGFVAHVRPFYGEWLTRRSPQKVLQLHRFRYISRSLEP